MVELEQLSGETRELLARFAFDEARFEALRTKVADGSLNEASNLVDGQVEAPESDAWTELPRPDSDAAAEAIELGRKAVSSNEVGVIILNGGMATRFGGVVKGTVEVFPGRSFLSLKIHNVLQQVREVGGRVPVFLMNSFATHEPTLAHFEEHRNFGLEENDLFFYTQGISLRMTPVGDIFMDENGEPSCYGPGHGDCPVFFRSSGNLKRFLDRGGRYLLISNVDNLAARLDLLTLGMHIKSKKDLTAEVAPKWPGDKGGAPAFVDNKLWVVEGFRFPPSFDQDSIPVFNTNTFTVNARALTRDFELTSCFVKKTVGEQPAVQIETLVGELTRFLSTMYLKVKRTGAESRFFPIKTPQDLKDGLEDLQLICGQR